MRKRPIGSRSPQKRRRRSAAVRKRGPRPRTTSVRRKSRDAGASSVAREFQGTLDLIPALAWRARADGFTEYLNGRWLDYTGASMEKALGWQWLALIHADEVPALRDIWLKALEAGQPCEAEARMRRRDGRYRWFLIRAV